ncbi:helix-turn-helix domain-containing protein [Roseivirga sp. 4D4]|uniref:helix-turn-helix domain-containing protein n=1 Tax=Roseivirga sp. 4D4 TaxID=1889784 RepID=UPI00147E8257|nr:helix-turn-helix transcriptional regulator [Roseivirga sp. 4D4]
MSNKQARSARVHLGLNQENVGKAIGVHKQQLSRFEKGHQELSTKNLNKLTKFFEERGLEFLENNGLREKHSYVKNYLGKEGFKMFMDDVYEVASHEGGDICIFNSKPELWYEWLTREWYEDVHAARMKKLGDKIRIRIIVQKDEDLLILNSAEHRYYPKALHNEKIFYIYGSNSAYLSFANNNVEIRVFKQKEFADIHRELFELSWDHSEHIN